ncbi:MAG TPA: oligosaccharide flippase family protein, partial [Gallicola sp.]|nr:oligosaccharide flippase family protein [Gallicola sp.]
MTTKTESSTLRLIKNTAIFFFGTILSRVISFFMLPLYTSYINPADFGYYDLSITYITIVTFTLFFDIWVTTMRFMYEKNENEWKWKVSQSGFVIFMGSFILLFIIGLIVNFNYDIQYLWLIIGYALTITLTNMLLYIARGYGNNIEYSISGIINTLVIVATNIILIVVMKMDFSSLYIAAILGHIVQCFYIELKVKIVRNLFKTKLDFSFIKDMFLYSLPLSINSISYWLLTSFNKIVVETIMSIEYNGYYAIGNRFGSALSLITNSFTLAWQDLSFSRSAYDKNNGVYYSKACNKYLTFLGMGACVLIPLFNILFNFFINDSYYPAKSTIPLFIIVALLSAYSTFI